MNNVESLSIEILRQLHDDFIGRSLTSDDLVNGYNGLNFTSLKQQLSADGASTVDFDLALKNLEEAGLIDTGPMVPHDNPPYSQVVVIGLWSKREYVCLTEKGYKAAYGKRRNAHRDGRVLARSFDGPRRTQGTRLQSGAGSYTDDERSGHTQKSTIHNVFHGRWMSLVADFRVLYFRDEAGRTHKVDLSELRSLQFVPGR